MSEYLGDGVYLSQDEDGLVLKITNDDEQQDCGELLHTVFLDKQSLKQIFKMYVEEIM